MKKLFLTALLCMTLSASFTACNTGADKKAGDTKTKVTQNESSKDKDEFISLDTMKALPQFKMKDVSGNEITNDIFKDKKYTLVTFWGTW